MNWVILYEDGSVYSSASAVWRHLPRDKKVDMFGVYDQKDVLQSVQSYDIYFYSIQAIASPATPKPYYECIMIAGFDKNTGNGELIKVYYDPLRETDKIKVNIGDFSGFSDKCFIGK